MVKPTQRNITSVANGGEIIILSVEMIVNTKMRSKEFYEAFGN